MSAEAHIRAKVRIVSADIDSFSSGEKIAVALVLDRFDLLTNHWGSILEAFDRLGEEWIHAALRVQRNGW
jgi:hypothetical protein